MVVADRELIGGGCGGFWPRSRSQRLAELRAAAGGRRDPIATILARIDALTSERIAREEASKATCHFVGIGGIGMSAIARILLARGEAFPAPT